MNSIAAAHIRFLAILCLFSAITITAPAQNKSGLEAPFVTWLMNNEAKVMSTLAADRHIMAQFSQPLGLFPFSARTQTSAANKLWKIHLQFFRMLPETNYLYRLVRRFGSGKLATALQKARPANWLLQPIPGYPGELARHLSPIIHKDFVKSFIRALRLNPERDKDLEAYRQKIIRSVSDSHRRLLGEYFSAFLALYPSDKRSRYLWSFLHEELKKSLTIGVARLLSAGNLNLAEGTSAAPDKEATKLIEELARLDQTASPSVSATAAVASDTTHPSAAKPALGRDLFNIWD